MGKIAKKDELAAVRLRVANLETALGVTYPDPDNPTILCYPHTIGSIGASLGEAHERIAKLEAQAKIATEDEAEPILPVKLPPYVSDFRYEVIRDDPDYGLIVHFRWKIGLAGFNIVRREADLKAMKAKGWQNHFDTVFAAIYAKMPKDDE